MEKEPTLNQGTELYESSQEQESYKSEADSSQSNKASSGRGRQLLARILQWRQTKEIARQLKRTRTEEIRTVKEAERTMNDTSKANKIKKLLKRNRNNYKKTKDNVQAANQLDELM
jgi:hypothetical protein